MKSQTKIGLGALALLFVVTVWWMGAADNETETAKEVAAKATAEPVYLATSSLPVAVSGIVRASDRSIVAAQTAGVIGSYQVVEGSRVNVGDVLVVQTTPVADAQQVLRSAEGGLTAAQQAAAVDNTAKLAAQASVVAYSAEDLAKLQATATDNRTQEAARVALVATRASITTLLDALRFVNEHSALFTADGRAEYRAIVTELYGTMPNYFSGGVRYPVESEADILAALDAITTADSLSSVDVQNYGLLVNTELQALGNVYATAEEDVLNRNTTDVASDMYTSYFAKRGALTEVSAAQTSALASLQSATDAALQTAVADGQSVAVSSIDRERAAAQAAYAADIAAASQSVSSAAAGVVAAERSLGTVRAPFSGVVTKRFKQAGEYAQPGEPLLQLEGVQGAELTVTVPAVFARELVVGQTFAVGNEPTGVIDRFSPVSTGNVVEVVISLTNPELVVGSSIAGIIMLDTNTSELYQLPRSYVHFGRDEAFVRDETGAEHPVTIVYDAGASLYVSVLKPSSAALVPAYSIALP
ncbi:HlyD family efflux transporter periplasmic adaptor subunit [Candidatus Kaiserbacteria bacterium]|nr:HlyD family efflux transporter periplasmic adaptor subunit [Candidatus Kaiserbacteria bacterium]